MGGEAKLDGVKEAVVQLESDFNIEESPTSNMYNGERRFRLNFNVQEQKKGATIEGYYINKPYDCTLVGMFKWNDPRKS